MSFEPLDLYIETTLQNYLKLHNYSCFTLHVFSHWWTGGLILEILKLGWAIVGLILTARRVEHRGGAF